MKDEQYLRELYYNTESPVALSNIRNIWMKIKEDGRKIKYKDLKQFLLEQPTYTKHKKAVEKFIKRKVMVSYVDQQWQADLIDMQKLEKYNNGYKWILTVIDIFSRYVWAFPLKSKTGEGVADAFKKIFKGEDTTVKASPEKIQFDEGREFYNKHLKTLLEENDIEYFSSKSDKKASVVERFNKTLKTRMWKYFEEEETYKWVDVLDDLVNAYNNSFHSSIQMKPSEAREEENSESVWFNLYGAFVMSEFGDPKFKVGDSVRIVKFKYTFTRGYEANFTEELFKIKQIVYTKPIVYKLEDLQGEEIEGYFYEEELSYVPNPESIEYKIEKVLKRKTVKGKKYVYVKWKGYDEKFNEWIPQSNLVKLD